MKLKSTVITAAALAFAVGSLGCEDEKDDDVGVVDPEQAREERRELKEEIEEQNEGEGAIDEPPDDDLDLIEEGSE